MLNIYPDGSDAESATWFDLLDPTSAEQAEAAAFLGADLPSKEALSEIETSSRVRQRGGILYMSTPSAAPAPPGVRAGLPIGFVLSRERLVTVRYTPSMAFDAVLGRRASADEAPASGLDVFVCLCEEIVDRIADGLEHIADELAPLSEAAFHVDDVEGRGAVRSNKILRVQLRSLGRHGDRLSQMRDTLVGLSRVVVFATHHTQAWSPAPIKERLASLDQDVSSLSDYDAQLFNKIQFLLDALVGLISIAQNDIFKVLTIVSIVGIPPTLVASMYGMNFHNMPEYAWPWGYQYGLAMIAISVVVPLIWFRIKGWF